jgi:hypothetical protein
MRKSDSLENFDAISFSTATKALEYLKELGEKGRKTIEKTTIVNGLEASTIKTIADGEYYRTYYYVQSPGLKNESLELRLEYEDVDGVDSDWLTPGLLEEIITEEKEQAKKQKTFWPGEGGEDGRMD